MTEPTELARTPNVIPYVESHDGERRLLTIEIHFFTHGLINYAPVVSIDGRQYVVAWGSVSFEIPADRNVHVSVHLDTNRGEHAATLFASCILPPHPAPLRLEARFATGGGVLAPVG